MADKCLKCGAEALHTVPVYNKFRRDYLDVGMCNACYESYTPYVDGKGGLGWKETRSVHTRIVYTSLSSRRAALGISRVLDRLAKTPPARLFVRASAYVAVALSAFSVALLAYSFAWYATSRDTPLFRKLQGVYSNQLTGVGIPGVDPLLPLLEALLALAVGVTVHELAHALVLRMYGIDVRRVGLFLVGPVPLGAFVEPPGAVEAKLGGRRALHLSGSGVTANLLVAFTGLAVFTGILAGLTPLTGEAEAALSRLRAYPQLLLTPPYILSALGLETPMARPEMYTHVLLGSSYALPLNVAYYMFLVNVMLAIFNSLPIKMLDGGHTLRALLSRLGPSRSSTALDYSTAVVLFLVVYVALAVRV